MTLLSAYNSDSVSTTSDPVYTAFDVDPEGMEHIFHSYIACYRYLTCKTCF